jgi:hypothetical protein
MDGSGTDLGPAEQWPDTLRTIASVVLGSGQPMVLMTFVRKADDFERMTAAILGLKLGV